MPIELCNARFIYQRLMSSVLQSLTGRISLEYFDIVIDLVKKRSNTITDSRAVFDRIRLATL